MTVSLHLAEDLSEAIDLGMHGSPTLLVDGRDPFAEASSEQRAASSEPSVSCRLYRDDDGRLCGAPGINDVRRVLLADVP